MLVQETKTHVPLVTVWFYSWI